MVGLRFVSSQPLRLDFWLGLIGGLDRFYYLTL